jgi:hypothetical protein
VSTSKKERKRNNNNNKEQSKIQKKAVYIIIIKLNSILYHLCAESTAARPITDTAQRRYW